MIALGALVTLALAGLPASASAAARHCATPDGTIVTLGSQHPCIDARAVIDNFETMRIAFRPGLHRHVHPSIDWTCTIRVSERFAHRFNHPVSHASGTCANRGSSAFDFRFSVSYA